MNCRSKKRIQFAKENGVKTKEETVYNENYAEKIGKEFIPGNSYTEKYLDIKVAVLVKKKTAKITHYQVSLDEVKHCFSSVKFKRALPAPALDNNFSCCAN